MKYIDEKFKEDSPAATVDRIKGILRELGIEPEEKWKASGLDHCWSLNLMVNGSTPASNGKGVTEEFARASAYAEFIERIQGGLSFYKFQDLIQKPEMYIQSYAPDVKYVTETELIEDGEWMDYIIAEYGGGLTRVSIAEFCSLYSCSEGKILTLPFYSLFEKKYVYLPIAFIDQIYATNGCCAGNTRDEAWVHALSEIMERRASIRMISTGVSAPAVPQNILEQFPIVMNIINQIYEGGKFDVQVLDYSLGNGFPVVATRIINKETQDYQVNVAADPVLEIAIQRTLTESFQGRTIKNFSSSHGDRILGRIDEYPVNSNVWNQLETSSGIRTADFFAEEITCTKKAADFADNSHKTNTELLNYMLDLYRDLGKPVYVRNFSYLGFPSYRFVVPGFSETRAAKLQDIMPELLSSESSKTLRDSAGADESNLALLLQHSKMISTIYSQYYNFSRLSGLPLTNDVNGFLMCITRSYAAFTIKAYHDAITQIKWIINNVPLEEKDRKYFSCLAKYIQLLSSGVSEDKIRVILYKFFEKEYADRLYEKLDSGLSPYEDYLMKCDLEHCDGCRYRQYCRYQQCRDIISRVGQEYRKFTDGQNEKEFAIEP